jgi:hypothetical protein
MEVTMGGKPIFPDSLRKTNWQQHRSTLTKILKRDAGIGKALEDLAASFDNIEWIYFDPRNAGLNKPKTLEELAALQQQRASKQRQVDAVSLKADLLAQRCRTLGNQWERSNVVPRKTRLHVQRTMVEDLRQLSQDLGSLDNTGFNAVRAEIRRNMKNASAMVKRWADGLEAAIGDVRDFPTTETYGDVMHQQVRGMGTAISKLPQYKAVYADDNWLYLTSDRFIKEAENGRAVLDKVAQVEAALKNVVAVLES